MAAHEITNLYRLLQFHIERRQRSFEGIPIVLSDKLQRWFQFSVRGAGQLAKGETGFRVVRNFAPVSAGNKLQQALKQDTCLCRNGFSPELWLLQLHAQVFGIGSCFG